MAKARGLYKRPNSEFWYIDYITADGKRVRESAKTADRALAQRMLDDKRGRVARGEQILPRVDKVLWNEAAQDFIAMHEARRSRDMQELLARLAHVNQFFVGWRLVRIDSAAGNQYIIQRRAAGASDGTIRNELDLLTAALKVAYNAGKLQRLPAVQKPTPHNTRAGFVNDDQFAAIHKRLPVELGAAMTVSYVFGWRKNEVLGLQRRHYDVAAGTLRLDPGTTKNKEGRVVHLTAELRALLDAQLVRVRDLERRLGRVIPWIFPHLDGKYIGQRMVDVRRVWEGACRDAGVPGILIHDLRRSAVRNMEAAGVPRSVAMKLTGHKTERIYARYSIVSDSDLKNAASILERRARA
jgi:integrase